MTDVYIHVYLTNILLQYLKGWFIFFAWVRTSDKSTFIFHSAVQKTCDNLSNPANGRVVLSGNNPGSTATYRCNAGFRLRGESRRTCQTNGQWSGKAPTCQREFNITTPSASMQSLAYLCCSFSIAAVRCRRLNNPSDGSVSLSGTTVGSTATYSCNDGFTLQGQSTRTCQSNSQWSGSAPTCQRKRDVANLALHS